MPIVLSYQDVETLGSLAYNAGYQPAYAGARQQKGAREAGLLQAYDANRNQAAAQLSGIQSNERVAMADIAARSYAGQQAHQFNTAQARTANELARQRIEAQTAQQQIRSQGEIAQDLIGGTQQRQRDQRQHEYELEQIRERARFNQRVDPGKAGVSPHGYPTREQVQKDVHSAGHLIPFNAALTNADPESRAAAIKQAERLAGLATGQIDQFMDANPDSEWAPYLAAVKDARRRAVGGGGGSGPVRGMPEGGRIPAQAGRTPGGGQTSSPAGTGSGYGGGSFIDPRTDGMSDDQIRELARDPVMLNRHLGANVR